MRTLRRWWMRARGLAGRGAADQDFAAELASHLEMHVEDGIRAGLTPAEARRQALIKLGGVASTVELHREQRGIPFVEHLVRDLVYSLRLLRKDRNFTVVAVLSLAIGIGANTAMFSVVNGVLLRPLPYPEPGRLLHSVRDVAFHEYEALKAQSPALAAVAGQQGPQQERFLYRNEDDWIDVLAVTPDFFRTIGVPLWMGREFSAATPDRTVILSHETYNRLLHGRSDAVGQIVRIDRQPYTIAGVAAPGLWLPEKADAFVPLLVKGTANDLGANTQLIARMGAGREQANAAAAVASEVFRRQYPEYAAKQGIVLAGYQDWLVGDTARKLMLLSAAVGLVLLVACFNLVNLLLARLSARQREIAVRLALGSGRGRLLQQFVIENLVVCLAGGALGVFGAYLLLDSLVAAVPFTLPATAGISIDPSVLAFSLGVTIATSLVVSIVPVYACSRLNVQNTLKQAARTAGGRTRVRSALVVGEVAVATALLVSAMLLVNSFRNLNNEPLGFRLDGLLTFTTPVESQIGAQQWKRSVMAIHDSLQSIPQVRQVAATNVLPLAGKNNFPAQQAGHPEHSIGGMEIRIVTTDYFETMGTPLRSGRGFSLRDTERSPSVVVINEALAREWWPQQNPVGDRIDVGTLNGHPIMPEATREVIGVVADTKTIQLAEPTRPTLFLPIRQAGWYAGGMNWVVRADAPERLMESVRRKIKGIAPQQRVVRMRTMREIVASSTAGTRFDAVIFGSFAVFAVLLACVGVYGVLALSVWRRGSEIGTRMALGASRWQILNMVLRNGLGLVGIGLLAGLACALAARRALASLLYRVSPVDPLSLSMVAVLMLAAGLLASSLPAWRAARVDPTTALRCE